MPQRSWLAKATDVRAIGGEFYAPKGGEPYDDEQGARAEERWTANFRRSLPVAEADRPFFGSWMHDSGVVGIERTKGVLRVRLDSIVARDMARILEDALDLPWAAGPWPVDLLLHDPVFVRAARADRKGELRFERWEDLGGGYLCDTFRPTDEIVPRTPKSYRRKGPTSAEFLYDWAFTEDGRVQWIAQLYTFDRRRAALSNEVYLMVDAARATAVDGCPEAFARAYGPHGRSLYKAARANALDRDEPFNLWDERGLIRSLPSRVAALGLTRANFGAA